MSKLKDELTDDPLGVGYAGMGDEEAANSLNEPTRDSVDPETIDAAYIVPRLVADSFSGLKDEEAAYVNAILRSQGVPYTPEVKAELAAIFPNAAFTQTGSRAEELKLGRVTPSDVAKARK